LETSSEQRPARDSEKSKRGFVVQAARYSQLALTLPAATVVGWLVGTALDRWLGTSFLFLVGLLLGIAAGFIELVRTVSRESK
jgi:F0F1-type ATP synthase assembly protein I